MKGRIDMTRGDKTRETLPDYAEQGRGTKRGDNAATLGGEPTVEGVAPDGGDIAAGTSAGGAKKGPMTNGPSDPANIAGREGEFEMRNGQAESKSPGSRS